MRKTLPLAVQSDDVLAQWPREMTRERIETFETELRLALAPPRGLLQKLWHAIRRNRVEARRKAAREPLLLLPLPFADRTLPDASAPADGWSDCFATWKAWAEASRVLALVRGCEQRLAQLPRSEDCNRRMESAQQAIEELTGVWMRWAAGGLPNTLAPADREALANLRAGIQNWGADRFAKELKRHFPLVMRAFPLWSVSNLSARSALPLVPGMFDLVIIDEASQCDIPSVVPLLARSKRAVFAGDPMQLKHVSTLDAVVDQSLLEQHGLTNSQVQRFTYRVNSAFDLADTNSSVPDTCRVRLDLHFRSHDLIADYCNEAFYAKTLHVVTVTERLNIPRGVRPGIHWTHILGRLERGTTGVWCADEVNAVREELSRLAAAGYRGTVGVVTPFRQQMIRLKDALETGDVLSPDFRERVRFLASTAHGFRRRARPHLVQPVRRPRHARRGNDFSARKPQPVQRRGVTRAVPFFMLLATVNGRSPVASRSSRSSPGEPCRTPTPSSEHEWTPTSPRGKRFWQKPYERRTYPSSRSIPSQAGFSTWRS